ncbi:MAG: hypothetical protein ACQETE_07885 [Bacteroidota bacterium]
MALQVEKVSTKQQIDQFHELPKRIYQDYPNWVPPFRFEIEDIFDPQENAFFQHGECERFLIIDGNEVVARFAMMIDHKQDQVFEPQLGGIGFVEFINRKEVFQEMLRFAQVWLSKRGYHAMRGPINFGENDNYWGLLIENYDEPPIYGMYYHPPYYKDFFEDSGAQKMDDHWSYKLEMNAPLPERLVRITDRQTSKDHIELRPINKKNLMQDAEYIRQIYNTAWRDQEIVEREQEFTELTQETVEEMVDKLKPVLMEEGNIISFVNGEPAAFLVTVPDLNEYSVKTGGRLRWWHIPGMLLFKRRATRIRTLVFGTVPKYRKLGLEACMFVRGIQWLREAYPKVHLLEGAWVSEKNWLMQRSLEALGMEHHKTHRTYRWIFEEQ